MSTSDVEHALHRLGDAVASAADIELFLVGGAAGMLTGLLPAARITTDCDVMDYSPADSMVRVELAAERVADELGLPKRWLNSDAQIRIDTLPSGWKKRRVLVGTFGPLRVFAASRPDLIAMKILAGRAQDLEDLQALKVRSDDAEFVRGHLATLATRARVRNRSTMPWLLLELSKAA